MKHIYIALIGTAFLLGSCDDFLNTMPDNRAEIDTEAKVNLYLYLLIQTRPLSS